MEKPSGTFWPGPFNSPRTSLGKWLVTGCWNCSEKISNREVEYEGYDGFYNNIARPDSGAIDRPLLRRWPAAYEDGSYAPSGSDRPNPLVLSENLLKGDTGTKSKTGKNALIVFFGQQVVEEILDAQRPACPPEYFNIKIPDKHPYRTEPGHTEMPFLRSRYDQRTGYSPNNPRQQLNEITPYLDGGLFYGTTKQWADQLRTYPNGTMDPDGRLASTDDGLFPAKNTENLPMANPPSPFYHSTYISSHETAKVSRFFKLGNPRGNENSFLLTFGIMWFRWHNYLATTIRGLNPEWSSEKVFNEARKWVIATHQKIVVYDWLPQWLLDNLPPYDKYDPSVDPQIDQFFQAAAFRFGHTLVVPGVYIRDYVREGCKKKFDTWGKNTIRTCNSFWRPQEPIVQKAKSDSNEVIDIDRLLMGMAVQLCEEEDHKIVEDLRGNVFGPLEFPRRDLMAINIQRGRDHGLPDYNTAREAFGLPREGLFTENEITRIKSTTIYDIIMAVTKMDPDDIPRQPFNVPKDIDTELNTKCNLTSSDCNSSSTDTFKCYHLEPLTTKVLNENCTQGKSYDYFRNSEVSYILTFTSVGAFIIVYEWLGPKLPSRRVVVILKDDKKVLEVMSQTGSLFRAIDFSVANKKVEVYQIKDVPYLIVKCIHDYDLVLKFESDYLRDNFLSSFDPFLTSGGLQRENIRTFNLSTALKKVITKEDRQMLLERFYRVVFAQAFKIRYSQKELLRVDENLEREIVNTELTINEFAEAMSMRAKDEFVKRMFSLIDKDKNGFISFREFVDLLIIFANGTEQEKARLLFDMYDINAVGYLTEENFVAMIKSFLATVGGNVEDSKLQTTVKGMIERAGLSHKNKLDFDDFLKMFGNDIKSLSKAKLNFKGVRSQDRGSYLEEARDTLENIYESPQEIQARFQGEASQPERDTSKIIDESQAESIRKDESIEEKPRFDYTVEREHSGLRRIAGYGVTITRGAASAMMFTYSSLLVTIKILVMHIIGHAFNFYHISTQTADDLTCLFRNFFHSTHELPKFHYWCWQTITGFTGVMLTLIWAVMYIFAQNIVRRKIYNWFWYTHNLYPLFFIFMILHGTGRLIQPPFTYYFFLGPVILFTIDSLISISRKKVEIPVIRAEILPSKSLKISNTNQLYLDGPFGEGHQDWNLFDVSVLIGGGIGVTPFASILKDVVYRANQTRCKKVYFIWVSRTQKQFEWLVDLIRELEYKDKKNIISCHIFITQFFEKFDLRTIFLYICERHYQRISNRSLFTNLKAVTHFGRPNFEKFFATVSSIHENVHSVGVFSCGPPSMTSNVDSACNSVNTKTFQRFEHHYKNF
ncbi:dual oxidase 1-like, partial [Asbolus verrucosus]